MGTAAEARLLIRPTHDGVSKAWVENVYDVHDGSSFELMSYSCLYKGHSRILDIPDILSGLVI